MPLDTLTALTRAASFDPEARTVEAIIATPTPVRRRDARGAFLEILDAATLDLSGVEGLPVVDSHRTASVRDTLGRVRSIKPEGANVVAVLELTAATDAAPVVQRIADGTVSGVSIGYRVEGWRETHSPEGRVKRPTAWRITEVTLTSNPADPAARLRSTEKESSMEPETIEQPELTRRADIRGLCRTAGLSPEIADELIDSGATVADAKARAFDQIVTRAAPVIRTAAPANDDPAVINRRRADALATRMAGGDCPEDARGFMGDTMLDTARACLTASGISTRGMSADETFTRAAHGTSDFPLVVSNAMNKVALDAFRAAESPLKMLARQRTLPNFKESTSIRLGGMGRLEEIAESGEITHTSRAESGERMSLKTYARGITVSRNLLINDDLGLLGDMTSAFGQAAAQTEADLMVALLTGNPDLSDGNPVFDASRGNIADTGTSFGSTGDDEAVSAARLAMRQITDLDGKTLVSVTPKYLVVGPKSETEAEKFLATINPATTSDVNPWSGKLSLVVEPRITDGRWYLFADPATRPTMQYGYLSSAQGVQIQRAEAWDTLGMKYRAFLDFGAGWTDWRGAYLNPGQV